MPTPKPDGSRTAFYLRVSTATQTTDNQEQQLQAIADRAGWQVVAVYADTGSGTLPGLERLRRAATRREFDRVAAWSIDRLGRSLQHLVVLLGDLEAAGVGLYLHQQALDTDTPAGRAMFGMLSVFAEFERSLIRERVKCGLDRARAEGKRIGRPRVSPAVEQAIRKHRAEGLGMQAIARRVGCGVSVVQRVCKSSYARIST